MVRVVVARVVSLVAVGKLVMPPLTFIQVTVGCNASVGIATLHTREKA